MATTPYTVTADNLKRGVFKVCELGQHEKCPREITHRHAQPETNIWNYQCTCECHPTAFGDDDEPDFDDSVKACPECETPNQFGEVCARCRREIQDEGRTDLEVD